MQTKSFLLIICLSLILGVYTASILDVVYDKKAREGNDDQRNCICNGPSCICCIDFNVSFIDLGGPGCVRLNYISSEMGIDLNVSYGDSLVHSKRVKGPDPDPTCLNLLSTFAQICARFSELLPIDDGLKGCIQFEPTLLGEAQLELPMGCFKMGPDGMKVIESSPPETDTDEKQEQQAILSSEKPNEATEIISGINAEDIIAAVNESANQGIALLSSWLGLDGLQNKQNNSTESVEVTTVKSETE